MPRLNDARSGSPVKIKGRPLKFSYWPTYKGTRRDGLQSTLFVTDVWALLRDKAMSRLMSNDATKHEAIAYLDQAEGFYNALESARTMTASPLLMYYCFMNLAKAYILTSSTQSSIEKAQHGLSERLRAGANLANPQELIDAFLEAYPTVANKGHNLFSEFWKALDGTGVTSQLQFDLPKLIPQLVPGHRLWAEASEVDERFVSLARIDVVSNKRSSGSHQQRLIWIRLFLYRDDLSRLGFTVKRLVEDSGLKPHFRQVMWKEKINGRELLCLEQKVATNHTGHPSDAIRELISPFRTNLWTTVLTVPPFRKYYVYLCPVAERAHLLPQLLSIYSVVYYLGSITRYRPQIFASILSGEFGVFLKNTLTVQPNQFLYLLASEFAEQEVTKPAIV